MRMTRARWGIGCFLLLAAGGWAFYQWQFGTPWRPRGVDRSYVFIRTGVEMPSNKGEWFTCKHTAQADLAQCSIRSQQGRLVLEAPYKTYPPSTSLPRGPLRVDPVATEPNHSVIYPDKKLANAPFINLTGGVVLLPAGRYLHAADEYRLDHGLDRPRR